MRILVVGGTRFVGRHVVATAVGRGHEVTVLHRGNTCAGAPDVEHLHADRDGDLSAALGTGRRRWDATIDACAYWPRQVASLADALGGRGGLHLLVSTVSVYADPPWPGMAEDAPLQPALGIDGEPAAVTGSTYGGLKVGCEQVATQRHGDGLVTVRPSYVIGPFDHTGRFGYWVDRVARGGRILVPGVRDAPVQYIDARDLAALSVGLLEAPASVTVHVMVPPPFTWADLMATLVAELASPGTQLQWVGSDWLATRGVTPAQLPLWTGTDEPQHVLALDPSRALAAGLTPRPLADSVRDILAWLPADGRGIAPSALRPEAERELLSRWDLSR